MARKRKTPQDQDVVADPVLSSSSSDEDSDADLLTPDLARGIADVISKIRTKDPEIYMKEKRFFTEDSDSGAKVEEQQSHLEKSSSTVTGSPSASDTCDEEEDEFFVETRELTTPGPSNIGQCYGSVFPGHAGTAAVAAAAASAEAKVVELDGSMMDSEDFLHEYLVKEMWRVKKNQLKAKKPPKPKAESVAANAEGALVEGEPELGGSESEASDFESKFAAQVAKKGYESQTKIQSYPRPVAIGHDENGNPIYPQTYKGSARLGSADPVDAETLASATGRKAQRAREKLRKEEKKKRLLEAHRAEERDDESHRTGKADGSSHSAESPGDSPWWFCDTCLTAVFPGQNVYIYKLASKDTDEQPRAENSESERALCLSCFLKSTRGKDNLKKRYKKVKVTDGEQPPEDWEAIIKGEATYDEGEEAEAPRKRSRRNSESEDQFGDEVTGSHISTSGFEDVLGDDLVTRFKYVPVERVTSNLKARDIFRMTDEQLNRVLPLKFLHTYRDPSDARRFSRKPKRPIASELNRAPRGDQPRRLD